MTKIKKSFLHSILPVVGVSLLSCIPLSNCRSNPKPDDPSVDEKYQVILDSEKTTSINLEYAKTNPVFFNFLISKDGQMGLSDETVTCSLKTLSTSTLDGRAEITRQNNTVTLKVFLKDGPSIMPSDHLDFDVSISVHSPLTGQIFNFDFGGFSILVQGSRETTVPNEYFNLEDGIFTGLKPEHNWKEILNIYPNVNKICLPETTVEITANCLSDMPSQIKTIEIQQGGEYNTTPLLIDDQAFYHLEHINEIILPARLYHVGHAAFDNCINVNTIDISSWTKERFDAGNPFCSTDIFGNWPETGHIKFNHYCGLDAYYFLGIQRDSLSSWLPEGWFDTIDYEDVEDGGFGYTHIEDTTITGKEEWIIYKLASDDAIKDGVLSVPSKATAIAPTAFSVSNDDPTTKELIKTVKTVDMSQANQITKLPLGLFDGDADISDVTLNPSLVCIDAHSFSGCTSIKISNWTDLVNLKYIGNSAFVGNKNQTIDLSKTQVLRFGSSAFENCDNLSINLSNNLFSVGQKAFHNSTLANDSLKFPSTISFVGNSAFESASIKEITFAQDSNLKYLGDCAFYNAKDLTSITIPKDTMYVGNGVIARSSVTSINVDPSNPYYFTIDGSMLLKKNTNNNLNKLVGVAKTKKPTSLTDEQMGSIESIGDFTFDSIEWEDELTEFNLSKWSSLKTIGKCAFQNFLPGQSITYKIKLPNSLTQIEFGAFKESTRLGEIIWDNPDSMAMESLGNEIIANCKNLWSFEIPNGIQTLDLNTLFNNYLTNITLPNTLKNLDDTVVAFNHLQFLYLNKITSLPDKPWSTSQTLFKIDRPGYVYICNPKDIDFWRQYLAKMGLPNSWTITPIQQ